MSVLCCVWRGQRSYQAPAENSFLIPAPPCERERKCPRDTCPALAKNLPLTVGYVRSVPCLIIIINNINRLIINDLGRRISEISGDVRDTSTMFYVAPIEHSATAFRTKQNLLLPVLAPTQS